MIFASDLDRTLIYSKRALVEFGLSKTTERIPVECKDGQWISFMTASSYSILKEICSRFLFVPVTTRTTEQFKRIFIFKKDIPITYAITSNGGHILYKGEELEEWSEILSARLQWETSTIKELQFFLQKERFHLDGVVKQAESLFFYFILESSPSRFELNRISNAVSSFGWRISLQGRKLYFIPKAINKGDALEFICRKEGRVAMAGAGDSNLDWDFLKHCRNRIVPIHGELASKESLDTYSVTSNRGILAGEEILQKSLSLLTVQTY
ncbi:hypothetical protein [Neobacillus sp. PS3-40]|uniref:hypothetical protein n=1 Tax=Neobacillus sp. PS3-40 TaxID=3070679 RepID=UPI0027E0C715|nr:hypothetical protein [Neobacillus sp. PS3-40]WML45013.1 hypothetical protein RCG20_03670 [Neobacillus sp. PS3-40]